MSRRPIVEPVELGKDGPVVRVQQYSGHFKLFETRHTRRQSISKRTHFGVLMTSKRTRVS